MELLLLAPVLLAPLGVLVLVRARETVTRVGGGGMVAVGAGWAYLLAELLRCDASTDSCGSPTLGVIAAMLVIAGGIATVVAGLVVLSRRFRRGARSPAR
jgi:hypothetical protein